MSLMGFLKTCPIHLQRYFISMVRMSEDFVLACKFSFVIFSGQNILQIFRRHPLWKLDSLLMSFSVILQHSAPYNRTDRTQLLYNLILVFLLMLFDFQMFLRLIKAPLAFPNLALMSSSAPPSVVTMLPRQDCLCLQRFWFQQR
ncbi:uncharacterized protein LOC125681279 isoform X2 [Ostrea edulis]|uniref:uncharacterized protein LOC125681279 isoform X2 n=1 Tax=Ostrea edulis TaxID=37623 RepID=UPI0024AEC2E0|nr:uncharacterized protein LOC125681279 isoform X2 [Ostrea edulis]